jgi:hypothetical protein
MVGKDWGTIITDRISGYCACPATSVAESDGALDLTLIQKSENCGISDPQYTTGLVSTKGKFSFTYGFIEARVWLPSVPGNPGEAADWPGVWLDGQNWPEDGEIEGMCRAVVPAFLHHTRLSNSPWVRELADGCLLTPEENAVPDAGTTEVG